VKEGLLGGTLIVSSRSDLEEAHLMLHAGLDLSRRRLDVCLVDDAGERVAQAAAAPDTDGLRHLARRVAATRVRAVIESMTGRGSCTTRAATEVPRRFALMRRARITRAALTSALTSALVVARDEQTRHRRGDPVLHTFRPAHDRLGPGSVADVAGREELVDAIKVSLTWDVRPARCARA
jgi:hypothetical protein